MLRIMSPEQVQSLPPLIDVQLHTHRHRAPRELDSFSDEIEENRTRISAITGIARQSLSHFCYPNGDYSESLRLWLRQLGVVSATTCVPGMAHSQSDLLLLPRFIDTMNTSELSFEAWASGFAALLPRQRAHRLDPSRR